VTAIFAASPFENGRLSGYKSTRAAVWLETDTDRASVSPLALRDDFSLEAFVDYALAVPMLFARRDGRYLNEPTGVRFGKFLDGVFINGERGGLQPIFQDWTDHLTTIFTEARLKQYIELRSADSNNAAMALAMQALWKGLMYDAGALDEALRLAPKLGREETRELQEAVAREGLSARAVGVDVLQIAKDAIALAVEGLGRVASEEVKYLDVLRAQVIDEEVCPADILLRNWHGSWHQSMERVVGYLRIA
jgi:glutamate--cysteine ligase